MSNLYIQEKYAKILPLQGFQLKGSGRYHSNFRCPRCGDSKKSKSKKRAWFERHDGDLIFHCYNCAYNSKFTYFLKNQFPEYYQDYLKEVFTNTGKIYEHQEKKEVEVCKSFLAKSINHLDLQTLDELPKKHRAVIYAKTRMIPQEYWNDIYYTDNFQEWAHRQQPDKFEAPSKEDKRILFVMRDFDKSIIGVSARAIQNQMPKYLTLKFNDDDLKIFGLDRINKEEFIYVFEGAMDAVTVKNSVAVVGATSGLEKIIKKNSESCGFLPLDRLIIAGDNEPRSKQTTGFMEKALKLGFKIILWPNTWRYKDINDALMDGVPLSRAMEVLATSVVEGTTGLIKLKLWKKI